MADKVSINKDLFTYDYSVLFLSAQINIFHFMKYYRYEFLYMEYDTLRHKDKKISLHH